MTEQNYYTFVPTENGYRHQLYAPSHVIAGDTDSVMLDLSSRFGPETSKETVIEFADALAKQVNASFPEFLQSIFNCSPEQAQVIQTEREVVSDKGCFMGKKNYIMHVVDKGGVPKDEYKVTGLATRRSDTPRIVRDFLTEMLHMLMDRKTVDEVNEFIAGFKAKYTSFDLKEIGRPMTIKGLTKYERKFLEQNSMDGFPYHVRASMFYNGMCSDSDVLIRSGDKIAIVYIKHPQTDYIALPTDANMLPSFLNDLQVNWDRQWETVQKKVDLYLKPAGYDRESRQEKHMESLVSF